MVGILSGQLIGTICHESDAFDKSLSIEINIQGRGTTLNVFLNELNITDSPFVTTSILNLLPFVRLRFNFVFFATACPDINDIDKNSNNNDLKVFIVLGLI